MEPSGPSIDESRLKLNTKGIPTDSGIGGRSNKDPGAGEDSERGANVGASVRKHEGHDKSEKSKGKMVDKSDVNLNEKTAGETENPKTKEDDTEWIIMELCDDNGKCCFISLIFALHSRSLEESADESDFCHFAVLSTYSGRCMLLALFSLTCHSFRLILRISIPILTDYHFQPSPQFSEFSTVIPYGQ
jgi:hypothetical protein